MLLSLPGQWLSITENSLGLKNKCVMGWMRGNGSAEKQIKTLSGKMKKE